jgi:hypothetical protein
LVIDRQRDLAKTLLGVASPVALVVGILGVAYDDLNQPLLATGVVALAVGLVCAVLCLSPATMPTQSRNLLGIERTFNRRIRINGVLLVSSALALCASLVFACASVIGPPNKEETESVLQIDDSASAQEVRVEFAPTDECAGLIPGASLEYRPASATGWRVLWSASWSEPSGVLRHSEPVPAGDVSSFRLRSCVDEVLAELKVSP